MGIKLYREPKLEKTIMFVGWPGIGNIGIIAVNTLKVTLSFLNRRLNLGLDLGGVDLEIRVQNEKIV